MMRISALVVFSSLLVTVAGCGGYSAEESKIKCDLARNANSACFTDATYDQCLECFETCGTDCAVAESCPSQYVCQE
jgi:hypothetical protein